MMDPLTLLDPSVFDHRSLNECYLGDLEMLAEVVVVFLEHQGGQHADIKRAFEAGDIPALRDAAHRYKGALSTICAKPAADVAQSIERAAAAGRTDNLATLVARLGAEVERVIPLLEALIRSV